MAETVKSKNRRMRQDALREQLAGKGLVQHVLEIADKLAEPDITLEASDIQRYAKAAEIKLKLIDKYLPSLKAVEHEGNISHEHTHNHQGLQDADTRIREIYERGKASSDKAPKPH